jgi:hypothetical protein
VSGPRLPRLRLTNSAGVVLADVPLEGDPAADPWLIEVYDLAGMTRRYAIIDVTDRPAEEIRRIEEELRQ